jgi:hydroxyethylthiazole kinase-like uncharacterized protein yjeF
MMITSQQMKALEENTIEQGTPISELMEKAGREVFQVVKKKLDSLDKQVIIFAGSGNNGGDGFVTARYFAEENHVIVLFFGDKQRLSDEALENYEKIRDKVNIIQINDKEDLEKFHFQPHLNYIFIDALLGTGAQGELREPISSGIDLFNSTKAQKASVDIPSGLDPDSGEVYEKMCKVDLIVCFHELKVGLEKAGLKRKTVVVDIGIISDKETPNVRISDV